MLATIVRTTAAAALVMSLTAVTVKAHEITVESLPPVVVNTVPQSGDTNVDPKLSEIKVTFSKDMLDQAWSWVQVSKDSFPQAVGQPRYLEDKRTCVMKVHLKPNTTYAVWLNSRHFHNFKDTGGRPAVPYLLVFKTGNRK